MQSVMVTIKGVSPLLMNRYRAEQVEAFEKKGPDEQARLALYEQDGRPFVPGVNLQRALVAGATFSKGRDGRRCNAPRRRVSWSTKRRSRWEA